MDKIRKLKRATYNILSGIPALNTFLTALLIAVIRNNKASDAIILLIIAGLFALSVDTAKKEIMTKIESGVVSKIYYHPVVLPLLVILFTMTVTTTKSANMNYYYIGTLVAVWITSRATINYIANTAIAAKSRVI